MDLSTHASARHEFGTGEENDAARLKWARRWLRQLEQAACVVPGTPVADGRLQRKSLGF